MTDHRKHYKQWLNKKGGYITSFEILKYEDAYIELLLEVEVESKQELYRLEGEQIRKHNCVNKNIAGRTIQEYNQDNSVHIAECRANYYEDNKVKIAEQKANHYQDNKEKIAQQNSQPFTCECGSIITTAGKSQHCKSKKHLKAEKIIMGTSK
jgi:hypothetical protein